VEDSILGGSMRRRTRSLMRTLIEAVFARCHLLLTPELHRE
jgi:hypothetical protein